MYFSVGKCARAPARFPTPTPILFFSGNGESRGYSSENSVSKPQPSRTQPTGLFQLRSATSHTLLQPLAEGKLVEEEWGATEEEVKGPNHLKGA